MQAVCSGLNVTEEQLKSGIRKQHFVEARQIYCYECLQKVRESQKVIALSVGYRHHTMVSHARKKLVGSEIFNKKLHKKYLQVEQLLSA